MGRQDAIVIHLHRRRFSAMCATRFDADDLIHHERHGKSIKGTVGVDDRSVAPDPVPGGHPRESIRRNEHPIHEVDCSKVAEVRKYLDDLIRTEPYARAQRSNIGRFAAEQTSQHGLADSEFEARHFPVGHCTGSLPIVELPVRSSHPHLRAARHSPGRLVGIMERRHNPPRTGSPAPPHKTSDAQRGG